MAGKERTMVTEYTGELKTGDLIVVHRHYVVDVGFYLGRGRNYSLQYFDLNNTAYWSDMSKKWKEEGITNKPPLYKSYIANPSSWRVIKISPDLLTDKYKEKYDRAMDLLKELKVIS